MIVVFLFITGVFVWAVVVGVKKQNRLKSPSCPRCDQPKQVGAPLCYTCTTTR